MVLDDLNKNTSEAYSYICKFWRGWSGVGWRWHGATLLFETSNEGLWRSPFLYLKVKIIITQVSILQIHLLVLPF